MNLEKMEEILNLQGEVYCNTYPENHFKNWLQQFYTISKNLWQSEAWFSSQRVTCHAHTIYFMNFLCLLKLLPVQKSFLKTGPTVVSRATCYTLSACTYLSTVLPTHWKHPHHCQINIVQTVCMHPNYTQNMVHRMYRSQHIQTETLKKSWKQIVTTPWHGRGGYLSVGLPPFKERGAF